MVIAEVGDGGQVEIYNHRGEVDVIFDVVGYFPEVPDLYPADPQIGLDGPDHAVTGESTEGFSATVENLGEVDLDENVEVSFTIGHSQDLSVGEVILEYWHEGDWVALPLTEDDGELTGRFGPDGGFELPAGYDETTELRITFEVDGDFTATADLVGVPSGSTYDSDSLTVTATLGEFTNRTTVRLNWQNVYHEAWGAVDDFAAYNLENDGAGEVTIWWNTETGLVATEGHTSVTAQIPVGGFRLYAGALEETGDLEIPLPTPTYLGDPADEPVSGDDRDVYSYSLDGQILSPSYISTLEAIDAALASGGLIDWYVNVHTTQNTLGEVRGQLGDATIVDGGLHAIVPQFEYFEFHELGVGTNTGEEQTSFNLWFDADIAFAGETGQQRPQPEDFVLTINGVEHEILRVRGDNPDWQPYPKEDIRIHLDTHEVVEDGDIAIVTILDSGAEKLIPVGRNSDADDLSDSWRTRCTHIISVDAMTSEPCGTPDQPGLSGYEATPIESAPDQTQEFSVTIEEPGLPPRPAGHDDEYDAEPWELWVDLVEVSFDGLVDYSESTWSATIDGVPVGTVEFWEYEEVERFQTVWEPFLVFTHDEPGPVAGDLVLSGSDIDGSDAAVHGDDTDYDSFVVRYDTGRADYTEIEVVYVPQPTITLEPADAVVLAEAAHPSP